jgi:hypothetical protein
LEICPLDATLDTFQALIRSQKGGLALPTLRYALGRLFALA